MSMTRTMFDQLRRMLQPVHDRIANTIGRVVVTRVNDTGHVQSLQIGVLADETLDEVERITPYGLISVPRIGAQGVAVFVGGDRGHPVVVALDDPDARPTGGDPGDTGIYHFSGAEVRINEDGDILASPAPGRKLLVSDGTGTPEPLVKRSEYNGHTHGPGTYSNSGGPVTGLSGGAASVTGTEDMEAS